MFIAKAGLAVRGMVRQVVGTEGAAMEYYAIAITGRLSPIVDRVCGVLLINQ